jgi:cell division protein FtsB
MKKVRRKKQKNGVIISTLILLASLSIGIFSIGASISRQADIEMKQAELKKITDQCLELEKENSEYASILSETDERTYIERIAIEVLGYAYPNERRFYDSQNG